MNPDRNHIGMLLVPAGIMLVLAGWIASWIVRGGPGEFSYAPFMVEPLPFATLRGFTYEQLVMHLAQLLLSFPGVLLIWMGSRRSLLFQAPSNNIKRIPALIPFASLVLITFFLFILFKGRAIIDDELTYFMQATLLSELRIVFSDVSRITLEPFTIAARHGFTGKYLFGEPLVQIAGVVAGMPALLHIILAILTLWLVYKSALLEGEDETTASLAAALMALSPMFLFTTPTGASNPTSLFSMAAAGAGVALIGSGNAVLGALVTGTAVGFGLTVRIQSTAPVGAVLLSIAATRLFRKRSFHGLLFLALSSSLWCAMILAYNRYITGSSFTLPWFLYPRIENYGFGPVSPGAGGYSHSFVKGLENLVVSAVRLNNWWLGWPCSFAVFIFAGRSIFSRPIIKIWIAAAFSLIIFNLGYYSTGVSETGPVYYYELLLPLSVAAAISVRSSFDKGSDSGAARFVLVNIAVGTIIFTIFQADRLNELLSRIHKPAATVMAGLQTPALLLHEQSICSEYVQSGGWVLSSFPRRNRSDSDPVVVFPRPPPAYYPEYRERYKGRRCYYYRVNPVTLDEELNECDSVRGLLERPTEGPDTSGSCLWIMQTAVSKGLLNPPPAGGDAAPIYHQ